MTPEDRERFRAKLKGLALTSYKILNDNCKYENKVSSEELSSLKSLMRNKNIVLQKAEKGNTVVIVGKEKNIQGVKNVISDSSNFIPLNIPITCISIIKSIKMTYSKLVQWVLNQESYTTIERFIYQFLVKCLNIDQFVLLLTFLDIIFQNS